MMVIEPENTTFSCLATGRPRPTIAWFRLSDVTQLQPSPGSFSIVEQEIEERERRSNLTIISTQPSDAGAYGCVAVNEPGTTAEQATLTVHGELDIQFQWCVQLCNMDFSVSSVQWFQGSCSHQ